MIIKNPEYYFTNGTFRTLEIQEDVKRPGLLKVTQRGSDGSGWSYLYGKKNQSAIQELLTLEDGTPELLAFYKKYW